MPKAIWDDIEGSPWEDELDDYPVYDGPLPPKGVYRFALKFLRLKKNKNDDPMLNGLLVINEPAGSKKSQYNGCDVWFNLNVTNQGSKWINNFLSALVPENKVAALRKAFWSQKVMIDKAEPPAVLSIGTTKITENMLIAAQVAHKKDFNSDDSVLDPKRFLRPSDLTPAEDTPTAEDAEEDWEEEEGETEEPEGEDDEYDERAAELEEMTLAQLKKIAREGGAKLAEVKGLEEDDLIEFILAQEFPEEEEAEEEDEDEELAEEDEEEEEPEPEPEPAKPARRTRAAAKPAPAKEEPPARTRTGTRRRRAASGEPPF